MKTDVLRFKNNGMDITNSPIEIYQSDQMEGVFFHVNEKNRNKLVIFKIDNVFVEVAQRYYTDDDNYLLSLLNKADLSPSNYVDKIYKIDRPNLLQIELCNQLGLDTTMLMKKREDYDKNKIEEKIKKQQEAEAIRKKVEEQKEEEIKNNIKKIKNGDFVSISVLFECLAFLNINVHSRTKGSLNNLDQKTSLISKTQIQYQIKKGKKLNNFQKLFDLYNEVANTNI